MSEEINNDTDDWKFAKQVVWLATLLLSLSG